MIKAVSTYLQEACQKNYWPKSYCAKTPQINLRQYQDPINSMMTIRNQKLQNSSDRRASVSVLVTGLSQKQQFDNILLDLWASWYSSECGPLALALQKTGIIPKYIAQQI